MLPALSSRDATHAVDDPTCLSPYSVWSTSPEGVVFWDEVERRLARTSVVRTGFVKRAIQRLRIRSFDGLRAMSDRDLISLGLVGRKTVATLRQLCEADN